jgi:hypothetical protein
MNTAFSLAIYLPVTADFFLIVAEFIKVPSNNFRRKIEPNGIFGTSCCHREN